MPASDLVWTVAQTLPVFQVYGTKRKSSYDEGAETQGDVDDVEMGGSTKKRCVERLEPEGLEINHNDPQLHSIHQFEAQHYPMADQMIEDMGASCQNFSPPVTHPHEAAAQATVDPYPPDTTHPNDMVMELCDETYTTLPQMTQSDTDLEAAQMAMDSDFTPNPHQYRNNASIDGDSNTASANVRCYCKPTWEGVMDLRPYVSDYY